VGEIFDRILAEAAGEMLLGKMKLGCCLELKEKIMKGGTAVLREGMPL